MEKQPEPLDVSLYENKWKSVQTNKANRTDDLNFFKQLKQILIEAKGEIVIAGGDVLGPYIERRSSDIDIYTNIKNVSKICDLLDKFYFKLKESKFNSYSKSFFSKNGIIARIACECTISNNSNFTKDMDIDLILVKNDKQPIDVVRNFDLSVCSVYYDGEGVYAFDKNGIMTRKCTLSRDYLYEFYSSNRHTLGRIKKYRYKGIKIIIPCKENMEIEEYKPTNPLRNKNKFCFMIVKGVIVKNFLSIIEMDEPDKKKFHDLVSIYKAFETDDFSRKSLDSSIMELYNFQYKSDLKTFYYLILYYYLYSFSYGFDELATYLGYRHGVDESKSIERSSQVKGYNLIGLMLPLVSLINYRMNSFYDGIKKWDLVNKIVEASSVNIKFKTVEKDEIIPDDKQQCFEILMASDTSVKEYTSKENDPKRDNYVFIAPSGSSGINMFCIDIRYIASLIKNKNGWKYQCYKVPGSYTNYNFMAPYIEFSLATNYFIPVQTLYKILMEHNNSDSIRVFYVLKSPNLKGENEFKFVGSRGGVSESAVSADHCQDGTQKTLYDLFVCSGDNCKYSDSLRTKKKKLELLDVPSYGDSSDEKQLERKVPLSQQNSDIVRRRLDFDDDNKDDKDDEDDDIQFSTEFELDLLRPSRIEKEFGLVDPIGLEPVLDEDDEDEN